VKIRVPFPDQIWRDENKKKDYIDDILMWAMETEMDISFYSLYDEREDPTKSWSRLISQWAVFTVQTDDAFMFVLRWDARLHKKQPDMFD
jgi:hypothetical protein